MNIIEIKYKDYRAKINISSGANCISLVNDKYGADIIRTPDYSKGTDNPFVYGMPVLYPANRISGGSFEFEGRKYVFPVNEEKTNCHLHGTLHCTPFSVCEKGDRFVKCVYEGIYPGFSHQFRIEICYELSDRGLKQIAEITNLSPYNMPNILAFHTTFNIPFVDGSNEENIVIRADVSDEIERDLKYLPTGRILPDDEITKDFNKGTFNPYKKAVSRHYRGKGNVELLDKAKGVKVVYETDEKYKYRMFYKDANDKFICLEPMNSMANCPNSPFGRNVADFDYIKPKSSKTYVSEIYVNTEEN